MSLVNIYLNRNSIAGDSNVKNPQGVLIGLYDATYRNIKEKDIEEIGRFLMDGCRITQKYSHFHGDHYVKLIEGDKDIPLLKKKVLEFVKKFPIYESKI
jgi:glycine/serine hydroxymethyltransferase